MKLGLDPRDKEIRRWICAEIAALGGVAILDGFPRTADQLRDLRPWWPMFHLLYLVNTRAAELARRRKRDDEKFTLAVEKKQSHHWIMLASELYQHDLMTRVDISDCFTVEKAAERVWLVAARLLK